MSDREQPSESAVTVVLRASEAAAAVASQASESALAVLLRASEAAAAVAVAATATAVALLANEDETAVAARIALRASESAAAVALRASESAVSVALHASESAVAVAAAVTATATATASQASEADTEAVVAAGIALEASETAAGIALEASETAAGIALEASETAAGIALEASETAAGIALEASESLLRELVANSDEIMSIVGLDGRFLWASPAFEHLLGYPPERLEGTTSVVWDIVHPEDQAMARACFAEAQQQPGVPVALEGRVWHANGTWRWFAATITDRCANPAVGGIVFNSHDVTHLRALVTQEAALARLGQWALSGVSVADLAAETVAVIVQVLDVDFACHAQIDRGGENLWVRASAGVLGGPSDALPVAAENHWGQVLATTSAVAFPEMCEPAAGSEVLRAAGIVSGATVGISTVGEPLGVLGAYAMTPRVFRSHETEFLRGAANVLARAIERRGFEDNLEYQMLHDTLTRLPNRALLKDRLHHALRSRERRNGSVAVLLIDLDDFKVVNDSLGHAIGDVLLQAVAARVGGLIRPTDTLTRFGGDEFVIVVDSDTDTPEDATLIAERVVAALQVPFQVMPYDELVVTASVGVAVAAPADTDVDVDADAARLISEADLAMYRAKQRGGNTFAVFDEDLRTRVQTRLDLAVALRHAVDHDEFRLAYQPEIDLTTGRVVDVEALLRWEHPHDGLIAPGLFLESAEHTGLIIPIGAWTITQACAQAATWQRVYGPRAPQRIYVNLSPRQLFDPDLTATIELAMEATGLDASHLGFEVTEQVFINDISGVANVLGCLHDNGHSLALDDFGTGYSSLSYLRTLPFDVLKIDMSFIAGLNDDEDDTTAIVTAIIDMAHDLGLTVTAEGIENATQAETLAFLRCDQAQGFHYSPPVPADDLAHLLSHNEPAA